MLLFRRSCSPDALPRKEEKEEVPEEDSEEDSEEDGGRGQLRRQTPLRLTKDSSSSSCSLGPGQTLLVMGLLAAPVVWALLVLAGRVADASLAAVRQRGAALCVASTFKTALPANAQITNITFVPQGGAAGEGPSNILYPTVPNKLPELCAVTVQVTSSQSSSYRFGIFLPSAPNQWKGRFFAIGNGGFGEVRRSPPPLRNRPTGQADSRRH